MDKARRNTNDLKMAFPRYHDFSLPFRQRIAKEFNRPIIPRGPRVPTTPLIPASKRGNNSASKPSSSQTAKRSKHQSSPVASTHHPPESESLTNTSNRNNAELLKAFTSANEQMQAFHQRICKVHATGLRPKSFKPGELSGLYNEAKAKAIKTITEAAKDRDEGVVSKLLGFFESANFFNLQKLSIERTQLERAEATIQKVVQDKFDRLLQDFFDPSPTYFSQFEYGDFCDDYDPFQLNMISSFGSQWKIYYQKTRADYVQDLNQCTLHLRKYHKSVTSFLNAQLCVDIEDLNEAETEARATLANSLGDLITKVANVVEEMRKKFQEQVRQNETRERVNFAKALNYASRLFNDIFGDAYNEEIDLDELHDTVCSKIKLCFETANFEYSKIWKWPEEEPEEIRSRFLMFREMQKLKRVVKIKEQAASLLNQLDPEHREQFFKEAFPEANTSAAGSPASSTTTTTTTAMGSPVSSTTSRLATIGSPPTSQTTGMPSPPSSPSAENGTPTDEDEIYDFGSDVYIQEAKLLEKIPKAKKSRPEYFRRHW